ncbi:MAG: tetratricopeptide repeat protein [Thaumarchaeota archaeon]|nr:MAG: tetratricopeptide repeat protein [Nitrososphaerota archaeon]
MGTKQRPAHRILHGKTKGGERRLSAIMFTDVVGYTSLTQKNEALALKLLQDHERLLRPIFRKHHGREVKTIGDSFLVEFASALEAVECANEVQNSMRELNSTLKPEGRILLRIGIHVGDVVHSRGDVYGDAVNVASRIESLAEPGCICISQQVYDHVRDKSDVSAVYIGKQLLKNVDLPVDTYRVVLPWEEKPPPVTPATSSHRVAILPLVNISPDPNDEYFSDGMTEELISAVSKVGDLRVISRTSVMKYKGAGKTVGEIARELNVGAVLEGSVRKAGARLRITMQLIDVRNDEHLWSQSYDRNLDDVFEIQSDIAKRVAEALEVHLLAKDRQRIEKKATESIEAYTLYLKGLHYRGERTEEGLRKAIRYFEEALLKDSRFALAYQGMADCYAQLAEDGLLPPNEGFPKAKVFAEKALELDATMAAAHATLGAILEDYHWDFSSAEKEFELALAQNPNYGQVCHSYGAHLACVGRLDEAVREIRRAQELNPLALEVNDCAAVIFNCVNEYDKALESCKTMLRIDPNYFPAHQHLAEVYLHKAQFEDAIDVLKTAVEISKGASTVMGRLGYAYAVSGRSGEARKILAELQEDSRQRYVSPVAFALVHCGLGEKNEAIRWLERAYEEKAGGIASLKVRPIWSDLRSEPGFVKLLAQMGLTK